jgi:hypothetical protein
MMVLKRVFRIVTGKVRYPLYNDWFEFYAGSNVERISEPCVNSGSS